MMRDLFNVFLVLVLTCIVGSSAANAQNKFPKVVLQPELWEKVEAPAVDECEGTPKACSSKMLKAAGLNAGEKPKFTIYRLGERDGRNLTIVFVTQTINDDDSIAGIRYRLAISLGDVEDRTFKLETLGKQYRCARGRKTWSKAVCP